MYENLTKLKFIFKSPSLTLQAQAGKLRRTGPMKVVHEETTDELVKEGPVCGEDNISLSASVAGVAEEAQASTSDSSQWWSYDSILGWPERMPHAGAESRQNSASSSSHRQRPKSKLDTTPTEVTRG